MTQNEQQTRAFNPNEHLMQIKSGQTSKDYLEVKWRLVWFRDLCPGGTIETEMLFLDLDKEVEEEAFAWNAEKRRSEKVTKIGKGIAIFKATVKDGKGAVAMGTKSEKACSFPDFIEKAETGAIGRALASLGYGTQFTGDEFNESYRIVDSPVERQPEADAIATEQQIASIRKLSEYLGKPTPEVKSFVQARKVIQQFSAEYREAKEKKSNKTNKAS